MKVQLVLGCHCQNVGKAMVVGGTRELSGLMVMSYILMVMVVKQCIHLSKPTESYSKEKQSISFM